MQLYQLLYVPNRLYGVGTCFVAAGAGYTVSVQLLPGLSEIVLRRVLVMAVMASMFYFLFTMLRNVALRIQTDEWPADVSYFDAD